MTENPSNEHGGPNSHEPRPQEHPTMPLERATEPTQALPSHPAASGSPSAEQTAPDQPQQSQAQHPQTRQQPQFHQAPAYQHGGYQQPQPHQPPQPGYAPAAAGAGSAQYGGAPQGQQAPQFYGEQSGYAQQAAPSQPYTTQTSQPKTARKIGVGTLVAAVLAAGLVGGAVGVGGNSLLNSGQPAAATQSNSSGQGGIVINNKDSVTAVTAAAAKAAPSVVTIAASGGSSSGTGSGIVLDDQGHILTNTHVVTLDGAVSKPTVEVRTSAGKVLKATVVGTDPLSDLAVIKVDPSGLVPATLGDSGKLNVGDTAVAIGSPLGLTNTVTDGIVSTLNRTISVQSSAAPTDGSDSGKDDGGYNFAPPFGQNKSSSSGGSVYLNVIQTDAAINPGNSGGALVNGKGEVIGVNVAIATAGSSSSDGSGSTGNIGVGFSIPINYAKRIAQDIIKDGKATHGQFGTTVQSQAAGASDASAFSVGGLVVSVVPGSAADKAGVRKGDVITQFAGYTISDAKELTAAVREQPAGGKATVTVVRDGQSKQIEVTLDAAKQ
ncbi:trypsin-like peptidase domain-containing protein [Arthrobacter sp. RAF14]|uniref:S1C family serine protease n=1 Tax=Arthrobacter sp. RAF14 TaxID=3233051 RepID=UPI003F92FF6F